VVVAPTRVCQCRGVRADDPVLIVGGGIGGLALAAACERVGVACRVLERAPALREVGAGVGLWASAVRALRKIGVDTSSWPEAAEIAAVELCSWRGATLARAGVPAGGDRSLVVHRGELLAAIAARVDPARVTLGATVTAVREADGAAVAELASGEVVRGRALVGADGLRSVVRAALFDASPPDYAGETCYRGVAEIPPPTLRTLREVQGPGQRCAVCVLGPGRVYWWAAMPAPEGEVDDPLARQDVLLGRYADWPFGITAAIAATDPAEILRNDLYDRPALPSWRAGRVTLLGDAAHPTTPNVGQGACMAIEDAAALARALAEHADHGAAFAAYESERRARTAGIVALSRRFGAVAQWRRPAAVWLRELVARATPTALLARAIAGQVGHDVGPRP
jgi:2-polyprenyl-6-methoxyphenol hydroxylase-like FAD-dependent oxidoreductase